MTEIVYPTVEDVIEINKKVLQEIKVRKADRSALLHSGRAILESVIEDTKEKRGDIVDKTVILLRGIIQRHPFESGNRRTAFVAAKSFLEVNGKRLNIVHDINILQGIREGYYVDDEIKEWLRGGKIRAFER